MNSEIYFACKEGFGNKVFELIGALYTQHRYNCRVYLATPISIHDTPEFSPRFSDIFYKSTTKIKYIPVGVYLKLRSSNKLTNIKIKKLSDFPDTLENKSYRFKKAWSVAFDMYSALPIEYKKLFEINKKMINDKIEKFSNTNYIAIHIRYGDKLCYAHKEKTLYPPYTRMPIYTPQYYIDFIGKLSKQKIPIIIMTDSENLVKKFIINEIPDNKLVTMVNSNYVESYYLLTKAKEIILSYSTFSFSAAYINKNAKCYLVKKIMEPSPIDSSKFANSIYEDTALDPSWHLIDNKDYILQYNQPLVIKMINEYGKCDKYYSHKRIGPVEL